MVRRHGAREATPQLVLGLAIVALGVVHVAVDDDPLAAVLAEAAILWVFAAVALSVGYRVATADDVADRGLQVATVTLGGGLLVACLASLFLVLQYLSGEAVGEGLFVVSIGWSVGASAGSVSGYYYYRLEATLAEQRDLTKRLTILQRVLRHNLRNEVIVIDGARAELSERLEGDPNGSLQVIERHVDRVRRLSDLSQRLTRVWEVDGDATVSVAAVVEAEVARFRDAFPDVPCTVSGGFDGDVRAHPDVDLAIREALDNAARHNEDVSVEVELRGPTGEGDYVTIDVTDTGRGIPDAEFVPLWEDAEEPLSHTSSLGLWLIYWVVERSGGELTIETGPEAGTALSMRLPLA